jgi:hypothetical protein
MRRIGIVTLILLSLRCTTTAPEWDSGSQRQEAIRGEGEEDLQQSVQDQFPSAQPF